MSQFLFRLGRRCARHPWRVLGVWLTIAAAVVGLDAQLGGTTKDNFTVPGVEAQQADDLLNDNFPQFSGLSGQLVFHVDDGSITDPANAAAIAETLAEVGRIEDVTAVSDPFDPRGPTVSADGTTAFSTVYFSLDALEAEHTEAMEEAAEISRDAGVQTELGGGLVAVEIEGNEDIGLIVAVVVLLFAFGSLIAMAVPIVTALFALALGLERRRHHGLRRRHPGDLDDARIDDRPRRRHRLRAVHRHPPPPEPRRRHVGRGRSRRGQRHRRSVGAVRRHDRGDRDHRVW